MVQKLINGYCRLLAVLMVLSLAAMVVMVFGNVVMRYGFNSGITLSEELSRWLFVWMTFLGAVVAINERGHLGTDSLTSIERARLTGGEGANTIDGSAFTGAANLFGGGGSDRLIGGSVPEGVQHRDDRDSLASERDGFDVDGIDLDFGACDLVVAA